MASGSPLSELTSVAASTVLPGPHLAAAVNFGLDLNVSPLYLGVMGLGLFLSSLLFFYLARFDRSKNFEVYFSLICLAGAFLAALSCPAQIGFFIGIPYHHNPLLHMYLEGGLLTFTLLCLYNFMDRTYFRRSPPSARFAILAINILLFVFQTAIPAPVMMFAVYLQGALFVLLGLYLFKRTLASVPLCFCLLLIVVATYEIANRSYALDLPPPPWTPYAVALLVLSRLSALKPLFAFENDGSRTRSPPDLQPQVRDERPPEALEPGHDSAIEIELHSRSLEDFSVFMDALHNGLMHLSSHIQKTLLRDDQKLKDLFIQAKTLEEGARLLGFCIISKKIGSLSTTLIRLLQDLNSQWNPLILNQEIEAIRKCNQQYLRINSKVLGRRLEYASKVLLNKDLNNLEEENPSFQLPEFMQAGSLAKAAFEGVAWSTLGTTFDHVVRDAIHIGRAGASSRLTFDDQTGGKFLLNFDDLFAIRTIVTQLVDNTIKHGIESSHERLLKNKSGLTHIQVTLAIVDSTLVVRFLDDGRGLGILQLREWAHEDRLLDRDRGGNLQYYAKLLLVKSWRAPRGFTKSLEAAETIASQLEIVLFPEQIQNGHCPFAVELHIPMSRFKS